MTIAWVTAFLDLPAASIEPSLTFWLKVTNSSLSPWRDDNTFATFVPEQGEPYLRVQRTDDDSCGVHLDFHSTDVAGDEARAAALGASVVWRDDYSVLRSPAGLHFCIVPQNVPHPGPMKVPKPNQSTSRPTYRVDQVSVDVPRGNFAEEVHFWQKFTDWGIGPVDADEYRSLLQPSHCPLRLIFQRLEPTDLSPRARAHLDVSAGEGRADLVTQHQALGATLVREYTWWSTLLDPVGMEYCLTHREP